MRKSVIRDLIILLVGFGLIWGIISFFPIFPEKVELLSVEKEIELGEGYLDVVLTAQGFSEYCSAYTDSVVSIIGARLKEALDDSEYDYNYVVIEDDMINAFSLPGGNILLTTGLINFCESAEEFASVMAHEMGHTELRHVISRLVKELGIAILTSGDQFVTGELTKMITSTGFDREQERAADNFACELLEAAKIEPRTLASFFRKLSEEADNQLLEKFEIVSTHPNFSSRIRQTLEYVPDNDFVPTSMEIDWDAMKAEIRLKD